VVALKIKLNGKLHELKDGLTIQKLVTELTYEGKKVAVAVNREFVPRSQHEHHVLNENDEVDIVAPMQGG